MVDENVISDVTDGSVSVLDDVKLYVEAFVNKNIKDADEATINIVKGIVFASYIEGIKYGVTLTRKISDNVCVSALRELEETQ